MSKEEYVGELTYVGDVPVPTLDMGQPIVRCRDCKSFIEGVLPDEYPHSCELHGSDYVVPNGFCAWGERMVE